MDEQIDFSQVLSRNTFDGLKNVCESFLKISGSQQAMLEFPNEKLPDGETVKCFKVYIRKLNGELSIHIVDGTAKEADLDFAKVEEEESEDFE